MSLYKWLSQPTQSITQAVEDAKPTAPKQDKQMTNAHCKPVFLPWSHKHDSLAKGADAQFQSRERAACLAQLRSRPRPLSGLRPDTTWVHLANPAPAGNSADRHCTRRLRQHPSPRISLLLLAPSRPIASESGARAACPGAKDPALLQGSGCQTRKLPLRYNSMCRHSAAIAPGSLRAALRLEMGSLHCRNCHCSSSPANSR